MGSRVHHGEWRAAAHTASGEWRAPDKDKTVPGCAASGVQRPAQALVTTLCSEWHRASALASAIAVRAGPVGGGPRRVGGAGTDAGLACGPHRAKTQLWCGRWLPSATSSARRCAPPQGRTVGVRRGPRAARDAVAGGARLDVCRPLLSPAGLVLVDLPVDVVVVLEQQERASQGEGGACAPHERRCSR
jgi:hypothetical protein